MKGGIGNLMKQAQKMQAEMQQAQERLAQEEVTGESGGGLVKVVMNGKHENRPLSGNGNDCRSLVAKCSAGNINC